LLLSIDNNLLQSIELQYQEFIIDDVKDIFNPQHYAFEHSHYETLTSIRVSLVS
jgi:hypothetical protein